MTKPTQDETTHTLASLTAALGEATMDDVAALVDGRDKPSLVDDGSRVVSTRISTDAARMYGIAYDFLKHATSEQLDHLPAFSKEWLKIAVWSAAEGDRRYATLTGHGAAQAAKQAQSAAQAGSVASELETKRDQLHAALVAFSGGAAALLSQAAAAQGSVADLARAVRDQTVLVRSWRASGSKAVKSRIAKSRLNDAWLDEADALAARYAKAAEAASATRSKGAVTQADVDYIDGLNLFLLRSAASQFEAGHAADPSIPRLTFSSLRNHVARSHHAPTQPIAPVS